MIDAFAADTLMEAIKKRTAVLIRYNDEVRPVEPHVLGFTTAGNRAVRVWQLAGGSASQGEVPGWRLMRIDRIHSIEPMDSPSLAPRPDYNPDDKQMMHIEARI